MKCNKCEAELEEGVTLCPECGCENAPVEETTAETAPAEETVEETSEQVNEEETASEETAEAEEETASAEEANEEKETTPIVEGKLSGGKIALLVVLALAAVAVVVALIVSGLSGDQVADPTVTTGATETTAASETAASEETVETTEATIPADGNPDDVTCKGSYTVTDDEVVAAKDTVVATIGEEELTVSELQIYYWMQFYDFMNNYGDYASYMGLDYTQPMDTQVGPDGSGTWQQYFLGAALDAWHTYTAIYNEAQKNGFELDAEYSEFLTTLPESLETSATSSGYESAQQMLEYDMGMGTSVDAYVSYMNEYYVGGMYYATLCEEIEVTAEDIEAYFTTNAANYEQNGIEKNDEDVYVDVRHILVCPQGGTTDDSGNTTYSEEEWETCRASAQAILDEWMAGDANEASFAALANERSEDPGSNTTGGLYEGVYVGQMVEPFENWCFDASRQYGDTGLVQTDYGYHVMYFVDSTPVWYATAESDLLSDERLQIMENMQTAYEMTVDYSAIVLNTVDFSQ